MIWQPHLGLLSKGGFSAVNLARFVPMMIIILLLFNTNVLLCPSRSLLLIRCIWNSKGLADDSTGTVMGLLNDLEVLDLIRLARRFLRLAGSHPI
jgi:hypothetical protein